MIFIDRVSPNRLQINCRDSHELDIVEQDVRDIYCDDGEE